MEPAGNSSRVWSDSEIRKVASLLGILRDSDELARTAAESEDLELSRDFLSVRNDALATLRSVLQSVGRTEHEEDEMEATHPGTRRPPVGAAKA